MRHFKSGRKLKRTASHRRATLSALSVALFTHKKIRTTVAKAKETRMVAEKLITRAKNAVAKESGTNAKNVHARRETYSFLRDRQAVSTLYNDIAPKVASRPGGYTRVVKLGQRQGDGAELAMLELVDYNLAQETATPKPAAKVAKPRRKKAEPKAPKETTASPEPAEKPEAASQTKTSPDKPAAAKKSGKPGKKSQ